MPRRKNSKVDKKIEKLSAEIETMTAQLAEKKQELKVLKDQKQKEDMTEILEAIAQSGMTLEQVIDLIKSGSKKSEPTEEEIMPAPEV